MCLSVPHCACGGQRATCRSQFSPSIPCRQNSGHGAWWQVPLALVHLTGPIIVILDNIYKMHIVFWKVENSMPCVHFLLSLQSTPPPSNGKMNEMNFMVSSKTEKSVTVN